MRLFKSRRRGNCEKLMAADSRRLAQIRKTIMVEHVGIFCRVAGHGKERTCINSCLTQWGSKRRIMGAAESRFSGRRDTISAIARNLALGHSGGPRIDRRPGSRCKSSSPTLFLMLFGQQTWTVQLLPAIR